jgi:hypothetical protein
MLDRQVSVCLWHILSWVRCAWWGILLQSTRSFWGRGIDRLLRRRIRPAAGVNRGQLKESAEKPNVWPRYNPICMLVPLFIRWKSQIISSVIPMMWSRPIDLPISIHPFFCCLFLRQHCICLKTTDQQCLFVCFGKRVLRGLFIYLFMMKELFINPESLSIIIVHIHRIGEMVKWRISCMRIADIGPVHSAYNPFFSACFFSRNNIFLSQQISQRCFLVDLSAQPNGS